MMYVEGKNGQFPIGNSKSEINWILHVQNPHLLVCGRL